MDTIPRRLLLAGLVAFGASSCTHQYLDPRLYGQVREPLPDASPAKAIQVRFLGVDGFLLQRGTDIVMTAPMYTNPSLTDVLKDRAIASDPSLIKAHLRAAWVEGATAILVGHSHYDHMMDVPYIATNLTPKASLYGSRTMRQIALASPYPVPPGRVVSVTDYEGQDAVDYRLCPNKPKEGCVHGTGAGEWIPVGTGVRLRALCSQHSSQFARQPVSWQGCQATVPPAKASDWKLGDTFAYLIDFLEGGVPVFRVYYQDSPTNPSIGYVPEDLVREKAVDLALLCAGAFDQVRDNPGGIMANTDPRYVLFGHWDNFFKPQSVPLETLFAFDFKELVRRMEELRSPPPPRRPWKGQYWFPSPGSLLVFDPSP